MNELICLFSPLQCNQGVVKRKYKNSKFKTKNKKESIKMQNYMSQAKNNKTKGK